MLKQRKTVLQKPKLSAASKRQISKHRKEVQSILSGKDKRFLVIIGPCSAWSYDATVKYAKKLAELQANLQDKIKLVMRVYTQKPRTTKGWRGILSEPDPCGKPNIKLGVKKAQQLMQEVTQTGLAIADEALFVPATVYLEDYFSFAAIGARSAEDQEHRSFAATRPYAVGIKNPTSGDIKLAVNALVSASSSNSFYAEGVEYISSGNSFAHLILRGGKKPNYKAKDIKLALSEMQKVGLDNTKVIIDCNHANSNKNYLKQIDIAKYVVKLKNKDKELGRAIAGLMIESFLEDGNQAINCKKGMKEGLSITDASLGWSKTEELLMWIYKQL